jgi:hypothetical protein
LAEPVVAVVAATLPELAVDFEDYFPALVAHAAGWLEERGYR